MVRRESDFSSEGFYMATYVFDEPRKYPLRLRMVTGRGDIEEVLVFDSVLPEDELQSVEKYLYKKWISGAEY